MAYNTKIADRFRQALTDNGRVEEKQMFGALGFVINGKLMIAVGSDDVMFKIGPENTSTRIATGEAESVTMNNRTMKSWVMVKNDKLRNTAHFSEWLSAATSYNSSTSS